MKKGNRQAGRSSIYSDDNCQTFADEIKLSDGGTKTVYCPVMGCRVDGDTCLEITVVADKEIHASVLPDAIVWNEEQREKCLHCEWHWT